MAEVALGIEPRTTARWLSHSSSIWSRHQTQRGGGSAGGRRLQLLLQLQPLNRKSEGLEASSDRTSPLHIALGYLRDRFNHTHPNRQQHLYAGVVSFQSEASTVTPVDANRPDSLTGGGSGGGSDHNKGEGESDEHKKKMAISMSQKFTLGYAALLGVGGVMGYVKGGSQKSLLAGSVSASLLYYVYTELPVRPAFASSVGLGVSGALLGVMGARFKRTGKVFPAGVVSLVSLVMTGGYLHGIWRSMH